MSRRNMPDSVPEVLEHFHPLEQEPEIIQAVRDRVPTHFFVDDPDARAYAWCSHCQEFVNLDKSRHRAVVECPYCGTEGDIIHTWRGYRHLVDKVLMYVYGKSAKSPEDTITARAIYMEFRWGEGSDGLRTYYLPWNVEPYMVVDSYYVFAYGQGAVQVRPTNNWKCNAQHPLLYDDLTVSKSVNSRIYIYANGRYGDDRHINIVVDQDSICEAVEDTPFRYVWDVIGDDFDFRDGRGAYIKFFDKLASYPFAVESLAKLGPITANWLYRLTEGENSAYGSINWRGKTLQKLFRYGFTKEEKTWLREGKNIRTYAGHLFNTWQWLRKNGNTQITLMDINTFGLSIPGLTEAQKVIGLNRLLKYLERQQLKHPGHTITLDIYKDYLRYANLLGLNLTEKSAFMPKDLLEAHDTLIREHRQLQELRREEELRRDSLKKKQAAGAKNPRYRKLRKRIQQKYSFVADGMMIYVPRKLEELIEEGIAMHSCVGGYVDRVAEGKTIVVFIRSQDDQGERIGTMEISKDGLSIVQARAKYNKDLPPEAADFVQKFKEAKIDGFKKRRTA